MKHIITLGEVLVDIIPSTQVRLGATCYAPHPGGAIANVAVAIARLGGSARFIGGVSEDEFGRLLVQVLDENRVDTRYNVGKMAPTAVALVSLQADGQRGFTFFRQDTADSQLQVSDLNWSAWNDSAICHVGGVLLSSEPGRSATLAAMDYTRQVGSITSFDVNIRPTLWTSHDAIRDIVAQGVDRADILKLSADESEFVSDQRTPPDERDGLIRMAESLLQKGPRLVILTTGARGALLLTANQRVEAHQLPVHPVDTTGAGDAFIGAILYRLVQQGCAMPSDLQTLSGRELIDLGNFANQVAGHSVTRYGGISSFPFMHEISGFPAT